MSLTQHIQNIMQMSSTFKQEDAALHKKHGITLGITLGDPKSIAYVEEARLLSKPLHDYLDHLDIKTLEYLVVLMYAGRDQSHVRESNGFMNFYSSIMALGFKNNEAKCKQSISEKIMNLETYFSKSASLAQELNFSIDANFN